MNDRLKDRVAVVTGAAAGIGRATAILLAKEGAKVCAFDGALTGLNNVPEIAKEFGVRNTFDLVLGDITKPGKYI